MSEVKSVVADAFCPHSLTLRGGAKSLDARFRRRDGVETSFVQLNYGAPVAIEPGHLDKFFLIQFLLSGSIELFADKYSTQSNSSRATIINPTQFTRILTENHCEFLSVRIERECVERRLKELTGVTPQKPVLFSNSIELSCSTGARLSRYLQFMLAEFSASEGRPIPQSLLMQYEQMLVSILLLEHEHNYRHLLDLHKTSATPKYVRRAIEFMHANIDKPIGLSEIAAAAGISLRALTKGFRDFHEQSPMQFLRDLRLSAAHEALKKAGAAASVTEIAFAAGFTHLGRFSITYREKYGVSPSDTLRMK